MNVGWKLGSKTLKINYNCMWNKYKKFTSLVYYRVDYKWLVEKFRAHTLHCNFTSLVNWCGNDRMDKSTKLTYEIIFVTIRKPTINSILN